jgi:hypothetical protein
VELQQFIDRLHSGAEVEFEQTMAVIEQYYRYQPSRFCNGLGPQTLVNEAGQNAGSCKIFAFAELHGLDQAQTLALFGRFYRDDVLPHPEGQDHQNIRNFIRHGWSGIRFDGEVLSRR